jgi:hypothetical protein
MRRSLVLLVGLVALGGCRYEFTWNQTHKTLPPEQGDNCFFEVSEELPDGGEGYVQLAEFTATKHPADAPHSDGGLRNSIEKQVCKLGGRVVTTHQNPSGKFTRGKVWIHEDDKNQ